MATTGENVIVTADNMQQCLDAWQTEEYYHDGAAEALVTSHGGIGLDTNTIPMQRVEDFCEKLRYNYGACINLRLSRAIDPKKLMMTDKGKP